MNHPRRVRCYQVWVVAACAVMGGCASKAAPRRAFFATCAADEECQSGVCYVGACSKSCTIAAECGAGICIQNKCKPISRVTCKADADCQLEAPDNGCRATTCQDGACQSVTVAAASFCVAACEKTGVKPGACSAGHCIPTQGAAVVSCADDNPCTNDGCSGAKGCSHLPLNGDGCDDGDSCTTGDKCTVGACKGGPPKACADDGNPCTTEACDPKVGCQSVTNAAKCDDGNLCTSGDGCSGGACKGLANSLQCDDGDPCSVDDLCSAGACKAGPLADCTDTNPCTLDQCQTKVGCVHQPQGGSPCDDGQVCTENDACDGSGVCKGIAKTCNDGLLCTSDACDIKLGCVSVPQDGLGCNDNNPCTGADVCQNGACAGVAQTCNDNNPCTSDGCNPVSGSCVNPPGGTLCDDGDPCTDGDGCANGGCAGAKQVCNDSNPCTVDACNPVTANCESLPAPGPCNDNNLCTAADTCVNGSCSGQNASCDDANTCTTDACNKLNGKCTNIAVAPSTVCDDGNVCTTGDICGAGTCTGGVVLCNDDNPCTKDTCDAKTGCVNVPDTGATCDDGNACSSGEKCTGAGLCKGTASMWQHYYGLGGQSEGRGAAVLGSVAVFAGTRSAGGKDFTGRVIAHDVDGPKLWELYLDGPGDDAAFGAAVFGEAVVVAGMTSAEPGGQRDGLLLAVDGKGKKLWQLGQGTGDDEVLLAVAVPSEATVAAAGYRENGTTRVPLLMTAGASGATGMQVTYPVATFAQARGLAALSDGYVLVGDFVHGDGKTRGFAVRTSLDGKQTWQQQYGAAFVDSQLVAVLPSGAGLVMVGTTQSAISKPQFWWVATDGVGKLTAQFQYAQSFNAHALGMVGDATGYMLFGYVDFGTGSGEDFLGVRVDTFGNYQYQRSQALVGNQRVAAGAGLPDGGAVIAGVAPAGGAETDMVIGRANPWGILLCGTEGLCGKTLPKDCQDGNPCTADGCLDVKGCVYATLADGAKCPGGTCSAGACQ